MSEYIANAFKSLDEVLGDRIEVGPPTVVEVKEDEPRTIGDLLNRERSFIVSHPFTHNGEEYSLFIEAVNKYGESLDYFADIYDERLIKNILVEVSDYNGDYVDSITDYNIHTVDSALEDVEQVAIQLISGENSDDVVKSDNRDIEEEITQDDIEATEQLLDDIAKVETEEEKELEVDFVADKEEEKEDIEEQQVTKGRKKFKKGHPLTLGKVKETNKELEETLEFNIGSAEEAEDAKKLLNENEEVEDDGVTQIVDVDSETVEEVKAKSYIGNAIIQCPVCNTLHYKNPEDLTSEEEKDDEGNTLYNLGDVCSHCGAEEGYLLVGQVASLNVDAEQEQPAPAIPDGAEENIEDIEDSVEPIEEPEVVEEPQKELPDGLTPAEGEFDIADEEEKPEDGEEKIEEELKPIKQKKSVEVVLESFDEKKFNYLARLHLQEVYKNIKGFTTTGGAVDEKGNIIIEGNINYKSGKERPTKFIFEKRAVSKTGVVRYVGVNETFANTKAFTLTGRINNKKFIGENLRYRYKIDGENLVEGKVSTPRKR